MIQNLLNSSVLKDMLIELNLISVRWYEGQKDVHLLGRYTQVLFTLFESVRQELS
jgi:hypothetical protein